MSTADERLDFMARARELSIEGAAKIGPVMTTAIFEFCAKALAARARHDGNWNEERYEGFVRANEHALDTLAKMLSSERSPE